MHTALKSLSISVALGALTCCSTRPPVLGSWVGYDRRLDFRKDQTFSYVRGTGPVAIQRQEWNGRYQFIPPDELRLTDIYPGSHTNSAEPGPLVWRVAIGGGRLTTTRPDGSEEAWDASQKH
jgi:hypothetical protein